MFKREDNLSLIIKKSSSFFVDGDFFSNLLPDNSCILPTKNQDFMYFLLNNYAVYKYSYLLDEICELSFFYDLNSKNKYSNNVILKILTSQDINILNIFINKIKNDYIYIENPSLNPYNKKMIKEYNSKMLISEYVINNIWDFNSLYFAVKILKKIDKNKIIDLCNRSFSDGIKSQIYNLNKSFIFNVGVKKINCQIIKSCYERDIISAELSKISVGRVVSRTRL